MITFTRSEVQQVLDAFTKLMNEDLYNPAEKSVELLRARLAQPEPKPHDYRIRYDRPCYKCGNMYCPSDCKQPEPSVEPVAWLTDREEMYFDKEDARRYSDGFIQPLYTAPPQRSSSATPREWVKLKEKNA